jgi:hypothetical protein
MSGLVRQLPTLFVLSLIMADRSEPAKGLPNAQDGTENLVTWLAGVIPQEGYRQATAELGQHQRVVERLSSVQAMAAAASFESPSGPWPSVSV